MTSELAILDAEIKNTEDSVKKIELLNNYSAKVRTTDIEKSLELARECIELAKSKGDKPGLGKAYWNCGISCRLLAMYDDAFENFNRALLIYDELNDLDGKARILNSIGNIYITLSNYKNALKYLNKSLEISEQTEDRTIYAIILSNMGLVYQETGDYPLSLEYYLKSMQIYSEIDSKIPENLYNNIGIVYQNLGDYPTALDYYFKGLEISEDKNNNLNKAFTLGNIAIAYGEIQDYDNSLKYFRDSLEIIKQMGYKQAETNALSNLGNAYRKSGNFEKALEYQKMALQFSDEINDKSSKAHSLNLIGEIYYKTGEYESAKKYYLESLEISKAIGDKKNESSNYRQLGLLFSNLNENKHALEYLFKALELAEEHHAPKEMLEIHKALFLFYEKEGDSKKALEHHKKLYIYEKEIANIDSDKKIKSLVLQNQIQIRDKETQLARKEKEIYRLKNVALAEANEKLKYLNEEIKEFLGIAVHDLRNPLSGILSFSKKIHYDFEKYSKEEVQNLAFEMEKASERMFELIIRLLDVNAIESGNRQFTFSELDSSVITESIIKENKERAKSKNIKIDFIPVENPFILTDKNAFKEIIDNLVSNAVKYTIPGKNIYVKMTSDKEYISINIKDEGPGLSEKDKQKVFTKFARLSAQPTGGENSTGLGLYIVKKLTDIVNGRISFETEKDYGTEFTVEFPKADTRK